jgi:hypothetical protein
VEDLTATVEQLTGLLRSMQSHNADALGSMHAPVSKYSSVIHGGGRVVRTNSLKGGAAVVSSS